MSNFSVEKIVIDFSLNNKVISTYIHQRSRLTLPSFTAFDNRNVNFWSLLLLINFKTSSIVNHSGHRTAWKFTAGLLWRLGFCIAVEIGPVGNLFGPWVFPSRATRSFLGWFSAKCNWQVTCWRGRLSNWNQQLNVKLRRISLKKASKS